MRRVLPLLLTLLLCGPAGAQVVSISEAGNVAVALSGSLGLQLYVGGATGFDPLTTIVDPAQPWGPFVTDNGIEPVGVAAAPDGSVRAVWIGAAVDYSVVEAERLRQLRTAVRAADGTVGPVTALTPPVRALETRFAANGAGDTLITWRGDVTGAAYADAHGEAVAVPADVLLQPAVASDGAMLLAAPGNGETTLRERPPGGAFGPPEVVATPGIGLAPLFAVALGEGGGAVIAGTAFPPIAASDQSADALAFVRPPGGGFSGPVRLGHGYPHGFMAGVADGGAAVVAVQSALDPLANDDVVVSAVQPDGSVAEQRTYPGTSLTGLAVARDGATTVGTTTGVANRPPGGPFGDLTANESGGSGVIVARTPTSVATAELTADGGLRATVDGQAFTLAVGPLVEPEFDVITVLRGPLRVHHGLARLPVRCETIVPCTVAAESGQRFTIGPQEIRIARVGVPRLARRWEFRLNGEIYDRRLVRHRPPCGLRYESVRRDHELYSSTRAAEPFDITTVSLCHDAEATQLSRGVHVTAVGRSGRFAAIVQDGGTVAISVVVVVDTASGDRRTFVLPVTPSPGLPPGPVLKVVAGPSGVAYTSETGGRVRVMAVTAAGVRVLDAQPGIAPASLRAGGDIISWTAAGRRASARLTP